MITCLGQSALGHVTVVMQQLLGHKVILNGAVKEHSSGLVSADRLIHT